MSSIIPFADGALPSTIVNRKRALQVNKDVALAAQFPTLSIEGKVFTLVQDNERKVLMKPDDPEETVQSVSMAILRINMGAKAYYSKGYSKDNSEGARPDCSSMDGVAPLASSPNKQAEKCALCPHNAWGSRVSEDNTGKGKACSDKPRVAVADPRYLDKPLLLRIPPASIKGLKDDFIKYVSKRGLEYNEAVVRIGFDREAPSPKLTFKPVGVLDDASYEKAVEMYDSDIVKAICGLDEFAAAAEASAPAKPVEPDELDAAMAARDATRKASTTAKVATTGVSDAELAAAVDAVAPAKPKAAAKPKPEVKAAPAETEAPPADDAPADASGDSLLSDLDAMLGGQDD